MNICVIGTGYVGLVTGACFADLGNEVICVDRDKKKIADLNKGLIPIYEPGLEDLVTRNRREKRLKFTTSISAGVKESDVIFIAVGTPSKENGEADLSDIENVCREIARHMPSYRLIVEKSTVPVETGRWIARTIATYNKKKAKFDVASNPEFLREGSAVRDFMNPDRIVVGVESKRAEKILNELYKPLKAPIVITDIKSAELIKHSSNAFLAMKVSFINSVANICEHVGADVTKVADGLGLDKRIGRTFLDAGIGYGGFCFPKDAAAFLRICDKFGFDFKLLRSTKEMNERQKKSFIKKVEDALWIVKGKAIGVLGLSFKPNTDDMRYAPSIEIVEALQRDGAKIRVFDPQAMAKAREVLTGVKFCKDAYETAKGADCLLVVTEWNEFKELDLPRIKKLMNVPLIVDGRNIYEPAKMKKEGFRYISIGRASLK
ncbi:MAG: UDP-glucose 6-dehydrogenase [Candidatus Omnitrophica bacterium CG1_02_49_10]|nr:MAG: UDP-glucose 6-dehydrogenase [Candidatus Omnitrophica bacterium CG1_02_49_10]